MTQTIRGGSHTPVTPRSRVRSLAAASLFGESPARALPRIAAACGASAQVLLDIGHSSFCGM
jgi:hypothetical protein